MASTNGCPEDPQRIHAKVSWQRDKIETRYIPAIFEKEWVRYNIEIIIFGCPKELQIRPVGF